MVGIVFYLVEYFPSHIAVRLEVNNPLYLISVFCVGELLVHLTRGRVGTQQASFFGCLKIVMLAAGVALVPLLFAFGPVQWHNMRDVQMSRLHGLIVEFYTYQKFNPNDPLPSWFVKYYGILPFFLVGALALSAPRRTELPERAALWISFCLCVFSLLLTLWQVRWAGLHAAMSVWLMIVVGHIAWRNVAIRNGKMIEVQFADAAMKQYLAQGLRAESQGKPMRVICDPDIAPVLYYFGGIPAVASYYWENVQGLQDATAFFTDHGDAVARRIAKERGLTQVIVPAGGRLQVLFNFIETGNLSVTDTPPLLATRLCSNTGGLPPWITLDKGLTRIGRQEFSLTTAGGVAPVKGRVMVYQLEPTEGAGQHTGLRQHPGNGNTEPCGGVTRP